MIEVDTSLLQEIIEMPGAGAELRTKVFGEMFNVAMTQGEYGKAREFMNKSLDEMVQKMKEQAGLAQKDSGNLDAIAVNTLELVNLQKNKGESPGSKSTSTKSENWSEDELQYQVRHALGEA